ncbi:MAG: tandem-95 repeat protein [Planctomycetes bacterium]|nr:tandem-95 repeat protein [Planctomycetota bacterium]
MDELDVVTLSGSGSDVEGEALTYTWTQVGGPAVVLSDSNSASPTFTAPEGLANSDIVFELAVSDGTNTSVDTVTITVNADNDAPTAEAGPAQSVDELDVVTLSGSGSDVEGEALTYTWTQVSGPTVVLSDANAASPTFTAPEGLANSDLVFELAVSDGTNTSVDTVTITVNADNDAPTAEAGPAQSVDELDVVTLSGAGSDVEGQELTYTWTQVSGPSVVLSDANSPSPTFTAPEGLANSDIVFELAVSDGTNTSVDTVTITVNADNDAPTAEAGPAQSVDELDVVTLSGSGSDVEGQALTYAWTQVSGPTVVLSDANAASPTFTAPQGLANSDIVFELAVSDGTNTSVDTVTITVNADNDAPTAEAGPAQSVDELDVVTLSGAGSDVEGQALTYTWTQVGGPTVVLSDANAASPTFTAPEGLANSDLVFELAVSDGTNTSVDTVTITVHADNDAPTAEAGPAQSVDELDVVTLSGSGSDVEGEALTYTWTQVSGPAVVLSDSNSASPTFTAPEGLANSDIVFELAVSDGTNTSVDTVTITVNADNDAPSAEAGPAQSVDELDVVTLSGAGSDVEGQALTYTWTQVSGPTVVLSDANSASPTFTAPEGLANSDLVFELAVSDGTNTSVDTVTITVNADNDAPTAEAGPAQSVDELDVVTLSGAGSDVEGQELTYTWTQVSGPSVVLSDANSPSPTFTAPEGLANSDIVFELAVSDGTNTSVDTVTITVNADNDAPTAEAGPAQSVDELDVVTLSGAGSDVEGQELTYTWTQVSGPSVVLSDANSPSPTFTAPEGLANSDIVFELAVSDGTNTSVDTVTITVNADNDAPTAEAGPAQSVDELDVVTLSGSGSDVEGEALTYTWTQVSGPSVVLSDANAASPTFTAPEGLANSDIVFELAVSDGTNTSVDTVTITVNADNDAPTAEAGPAQSVDELDVVTLSGSGSDVEGEALTYTWTQVGGPAVVLSDSNSASPTFTAPGGLANSDIVFELAVSDGTNMYVETVTITVNADNDAPTDEAGPAQ